MRTPEARMLLGLALLCGCRTALRTDLSEREARDVVVALERAAVPAQRHSVTGRPDRFEVEIATDDVARALGLLEAQKLPRTAPKGFAELYAGSGLISTPEEERVRFVAATAGELERSLERMPHVLAARVHLAAPPVPAELDEPAAHGSASVFVERERGAAPIDEAAIRTLVAGAFASLRAADVAVIQAEAAAIPIASGFVYIGPFAIARGSVAGLRALLFGLFTLDLVLAFLLVVLVARLRRTRSLNET